MRILLIAGFGILIYLKFDSFISLKIFSFLSHPNLAFKSEPGLGSNSKSAVQSEVKSGPMAIRWSLDSNNLEMACLSVPFSECLKTSPLLDSNTLGSLRALINKTKLSWQLPEIMRFTANFQKKLDSNTSQKAFQIIKLDLLTANETVTLTAQANGDGIKYCHGKRCLDELDIKLPFQNYALPLRSSIHPFAIELRPLERTAFHPILPGSIAAIQDQVRQVKIYHGKEIYSVYSGFNSLAPKLEIGKFMRTEDTVGYLDPALDSLAQLTLGIEKNGTFIDPIPFLGIQAAPNDS